ncbi:hypothetical protein [Actinomycetospora sp. TBRC 11914]|uniref:hypothetical protein n=1 Tax=Actinomycetospora sp. TBRC 11914 TaxID=2729387 RepID=UPI00145C5096|nr:hypothetical protein [Actinomycetospora sp. TBRC 11914]NMO90874.1 hypothetical protein [Actinomycetospora sp. TBRC 11914]
MSSAREAADALRAVVSRARDAESTGQEPAEVLAELARVAGLLGRTVEGVAGEDGGAVRATADRLARAIAAHRGLRTG